MQTYIHKLFVEQHVPGLRLETDHCSIFCIGVIL